MLVRADPTWKCKASLYQELEDAKDFACESERTCAVLSKIGVMASEIKQRTAERTPSGVQSKRTLRLWIICLPGSKDSLFCQLQACFYKGDVSDCSWGNPQRWSTRTVCLDGWAFDFPATRPRHSFGLHQCRHHWYHWVIWHIMKSAASVFDAKRTAWRGWERTSARWYGGYQRQDGGSTAARFQVSSTSTHSFQHGAVLLAGGFILGEF